jgi:3',5'-cyclic AMP phosphodiesterase CpdA
MAADLVRIVCISDTHNDDCTDHLPDGDILIHAGDMTDDGTADELQAAYDWISALPHKVKIIVAGQLNPMA